MLSTDTKSTGSTSAETLLSSISQFLATNDVTAENFDFGEFWDKLRELHVNIGKENDDTKNSEEIPASKGQLEDAVVEATQHFVPNSEESKAAVLSAGKESVKNGGPPAIVVPDGVLQSIPEKEKAPVDVTVAIDEDFQSFNNEAFEKECAAMFLVDECKITSVTEGSVIVKFEVNVTRSGAEYIARTVSGNITESEKEKFLEEHAAAINQTMDEVLRNLDHNKTGLKIFAVIIGEDKSVSLSTTSPTAAPQTASPTVKPTTASPTTGSPTEATKSPTTGSPTTGSPTTGSPTTGAPTTSVPCKDDPSKIVDCKCWYEENGDQMDVPCDDCRCQLEYRRADVVNGTVFDFYKCYNKTKALEVFQQNQIIIECLKNI